MNALTVIAAPSVPVVLKDELELAADFAKASKARATQEAYSSDFRIFDRWCRERGLSSLPATPATVAAFLAAQAGLGKRASTLGRRLASIKYFHGVAGEPSPTADEKIKATLSGIRRSIGSAPVRKKAAVAEIVIAMASKAETLQQIRDRALLLVGFAGAFRRSELIGLDAEDIEEVAEGLLLNIRRSKVDQEGKGRKVAIARGTVACPVEALKAWMAAAGISSGPLFRRVHNKRGTVSRLSGRAVAAVVKREAARLGMDPKQFGGHSLRSGFVTSAIRRNANLVKITAVTGHASLEMLKIYHREVDAFVDHAGAGLL